MKKSLLEKLLEYYHLTYEEYINITRPVSLNDLPSPFLFKRMDEAVELVKKHIELNHKIVVYGDYDADGICGCSILVKMFKYLKYDVGYYIPSRYLDGYGINEKRAQEIIDKGYHLVICVDNGVSANNPIKMLREANIDVLVIDHHEPQEELPIANVIIHPIISEFSNINSSGAFTAFMFSIALLGYIDKYLATLASISLISDMMPLKDYNRLLLRAIIKGYKYGEFPQVDYLLENGVFDETSIGMSIAPKINAVGRMNKTTTINRLIKYFISEDNEEILSYKKWILSFNDARKEKQKETKDDILSNIKDFNEPSMILVTDLEEGLIGLFANTIMTQFNVPAIVFTQDSTNPDWLKGSARSIEGFSLADSFVKLSHLLVHHGGHALAAGLTIEKSKLEEFKVAFNDLVRKTPIVKKKKETIDLNINEVSEETYRLVESFSPFGEEWKPPLFKLRHIKASELMYSKNGQNIISSLSLRSRIIGFGYSKEKMSHYDFIDLIGTLRINDFNGKIYIEFLISEII